MRTKYLDPDYRGKTPKTDCWCAKCQRDLKPEQKKRWVHCIEGGMTVLHPEDEDTYTSDGGEMGWFPIGMDCAKALGLEWTSEAPR